MIEERATGALSARGREMAALIAEQERSGLSAREFARQRGIAEGTMSWWRRELRLRGALGRSADTGSAALIPVAVVDEVRATGATPSRDGFVVHTAAGMKVEVPSGFDAAELRRLLEALSC